MPPPPAFHSVSDLSVKPSDQKETDAPASGSVITDAPSESVLPGPVAARIHALWDELTDFGAHETDAAVVHALRVLSDLAGVQRAFWLGAVRLGTKLDPMAG